MYDQFIHVLVLHVLNVELIFLRNKSQNDV